MTMTDVTFDHLWLLPAAILLPLLAILVLRHAYRQRRARLQRLGNIDVVTRLLPPNTQTRPR